MSEPPSKTPTELHLLRHGAVAPPWPGRLYGDLDVPLSEFGQRQSEASAHALAHLDLAAVISSGLARAEHMAAHLRSSRPELERRDEPRLKEMSRGHWAGFGLEELKASDPEAFAVWRDRRGLIHAPGGESIFQVAERVGPALDELAREFAGRCVAVVAHSWVVRSATCLALGLALEECTRFEVPTGGRVVLRWRAREGAGARGELLGMGPSPLVREV